MTHLYQSKVVVKKSRLHGYGVFAAKNFKKGEVIEECYAIISPKGDDEVLEDYYFDANGKYAFLTGFGSVYNHSDHPNADYKINLRKKIFTFIADRAIKKGEEILVDYGDEWFEARNIKKRK